MSIKYVLQSEADSATGKAITIPFEFTDTSSVPKGKNPGESIVITPIKVRTWMQLKPLLAQIESKDLEKLINHPGKKLNEDVFNVISKYDELLFSIMCIGIHNRVGDMPEWFRKTLKENCTWEDVFVVINAIFFRLAHNPFMNTITLLKSVSPIGEREIIALQKNKETWKCKAASLSS